MPLSKSFLSILSLSLFFSTPLLVQADSSIFSQFIGATTASGPSGTGLDATSFTICTDYLHGLPALSNIGTSLSSQLEQEAVDGVCKFCTSLGQSRVNSCCGVATSSACFAQFAGSGSGPGTGVQQSTPASAAAMPTATGGSGSGSGGSSSTPSRSSNEAGRSVNKDLFADSLIAAVVGLVGWVL